MRKLINAICCTILLMIFLWYLTYGRTNKLINDIDVENTHINFIRTGSGDLIEINESLEMFIINNLGDLVYRPSINLLPRGG